ncbi:MAG: diguanylate cyclase [Gammaproteobacteria bacterium]|uniref:sensor domain-containing diguanylate cyclase n=1 Tax=Rhodoferax sp. TaxID=50421 RepID=UPI00185D812A|nr:sensor domain-containing diguanylate cyclase [Rhodoferax sp.]MBU3899874.1 diguanylate cyclase [Gammaproteobacteria bacterium]MBA3058630.1 diguanylate cyclase [Rhodoferax sp.]MBU3996057.1 diguanylate cyclase [Gammaproteobacteria bacterium]MBU4019139.1 diguanylate cyclase [Gammaproteobacteria bacterium]MBU4078857.1 diguanylate cyclase [Gammaproteobacteria bacterium]
MVNITNTKLDAFALLDMLPVGVVVHGPDTRILHANKKALAVLRMTADQARGKETMDFQWQIVDTYRQPLALEQFPVSQVLATGEPVQGQLLGVSDSSSAEITWLTVNAVAERDGQGAVARVVVTFTENTYERADIPFKDIVDSAQDIVIVTEAQPFNEPGPRIIYVNAAFTQLTGFTPQEVIGKTPRILQREDADPVVLKRISAGLALGQPVREIIYNYAKEGRGYWLDMHIFPLKNTQGEVAYFAAIERDVTVQKNLEHELRHFAFHDALTHLPNRRLLLERLKHSLVLAKRSANHIAVLFIDLDKFKHLNDTHGHDAGDLLLAEVATRLSSRVRESDVAARLGGDEFVVLLDGLGTDLAHAEQHVQTVVDKIQAALEEAYVLGDIVYHGSASIGVKLISGGGDHDPDQILKDADEAMYFVKKNSS